MVNYTVTAQLNRNAPVRLFAVLALLSRYPFGLMLNPARFRVGSSISWGRQLAFRGLEGICIASSIKPIVI